MCYYLNVQFQGQRVKLEKGDDYELANLWRVMTPARYLAI